MKLEDVIEKIESAENGQWDGAGDAQAFMIRDILMDHGWISAEKDVYSECSKATTEFNLKKAGKKVNVVASCFMGNFIIWSVSNVS